MGDFWKNIGHAKILKDCIRTVIRDMNEGSFSGNGTNSILLFLVKTKTDLHNNNNSMIVMEVYDGATFRSCKRFSGLPPRKKTLLTSSAEEENDKQNASSSHLLLDYESLPPIKRCVVDLVDLLLEKNIAFDRIVIRIEKQKRQLLAKLTGKRRNPLCVMDGQKKNWGYAMQLNPNLKNEVFESFVDWIEEGSQGRAPDGIWNGFYTIGRINSPPAATTG